MAWIGFPWGYGLSIDGGGTFDYSYKMYQKGSTHHPPSSYLPPPTSSYHPPPTSLLLPPSSYHPPPTTLLLPPSSYHPPLDVSNTV